MKDSGNFLMPRVYQYSLTGEFLSVYETLSDASRASGEKYKKIARCAASLTKDGCGASRRVWTEKYIWTYTPDVDMEAVAKLLASIQRVYKFSLDGSIAHIYSSMAEAAKDLGITRRTLSDRFQRHGTFRQGEYEYSRSLDRPRLTCRRILGGPFRGTHLITGETVIYPTLESAGKDLGINGKGIGNCIRGIRKSAGGYSWERIPQESTWERTSTS